MSISVHGGSKYMSHSVPLTMEEATEEHAYALLTVPLSHSRIFHDHYSLVLKRAVGVETGCAWASRVLGRKIGCAADLLALTADLDALRAALIQR